MSADQSVGELLRQLAEKETKILELLALLQAMEEFKGQAESRQLESDLNPLPIPRLELRGTSAGDSVEWRYSLVYRHFLGHIVFVLFGVTLASGGGIAKTPGGIGLPMRDGVHIRHDMKELRLPAFAIYGERVEELTPA